MSEIVCASVNIGLVTFEIFPMETKKSAIVIA